MTCKFCSLGCIVLQETCERRSEISPQRVINNGVSESRWPLLLLVGGILADQGLGNSPPPHSQVARGRGIQSFVHASYQYDQFLDPGQKQHSYWSWHNISFIKWMFDQKRVLVLIVISDGQQQLPLEVGDFQYTSFTLCNHQLFIVLWQLCKSDKWLV